MYVRQVDVASNRRLNYCHGMRAPGMIYNVCHPILRLLRTNRWIIRRIFGVRVPKGMAVQFDPTTVLLAHALQQIATDEDNASFEVGIGQGALISLSLAGTYPLVISGIDCSAERVETSRQLAEFNGIDAEYFESDLFSNVPNEARFDLIFFNPPYVPTEVGRQLQLTSRLEVDGDQMWDGGEDGTAVLREFLRQAPRFLEPRGRILFGVQNIFVSDEQVLAAISDSELIMLERIKKRFVPSTVYVLAKDDAS